MLWVDSASPMPKSTCLLQRFTGTALYAVGKDIAAGQRIGTGGYASSYPLPSNANHPEIFTTMPKNMGLRLFQMLEASESDET
jgi:hypothetical protein